MSSPVFNHLLVSFWAEECVNRHDRPAINPAKSNSLGCHLAWRLSYLSQYHNTSLAMFARNKDCRLQQARMWSEWKELQARETLASHAVLLLAHPPPQPQPRCSSIALLFPQAASVPERFAVMPCTRAPQQFTNGSLLVSVTAYLRSEMHTTNHAQISLWS